jgi:tRNA-Thr(GGU) m(6)t(6)A37 methyltransferase TsaA
VDKYKLKVIPFLDTVEKGVFATRSPVRPNHLGLSLVELVSVNGNTLNIRGVDMLDGSPVLDIKPYVPEFDRHENVRRGWLEGKSDTAESKLSDGRFR